MQNAKEPASSPYDAASVRAAARSYAYDAYLAATLAPSADREDLITLAAYFGEIARVALEVSEPALGEIRLQWWREAMEGQVPSGHPVADRMVVMSRRRGLPETLLLTPIEAASALLYAEPFAGEGAFEGMLGGLDGVHMRLRGTILGADAVQGGDLLDEAGRALGLVRFLAKLPCFLAKGRMPLPAARLPSPSQEGGFGADSLPGVRTAVMEMVNEGAARIAEVRSLLRVAEPRTRRAALPFALAGPYLRGVQRPGRDPLRDVVELSPLERVLAVGACHVTLRF